MTDHLDRVVADEIDASERTRDDVPDAAGSRPNQAAARVYSVRLAPDMVDEVERMAAEHGVPTSALIRSFIADGLNSQRGLTVMSAVAAIEADVRRLRALV